MNGEQSHSDRQPRVSLVHHFLDDAAARQPSAIAVRDEEGAWTYRELHEQSLRVTTWLADHGIGRGDRVLVRLPNSRHMTALLYGVMRMGAVLVPVSQDMRPYELSGVLRNAEPTIVITEASEHVQTSSAVMALTLGEVSRELDRTAPRHPTAEVGPSDIALLLYTSGSTSAPRGVVCRHEQVAFAAWGVADRLGYRADDVVYCRLPFSFDYGLYQIFLAALAGCELAVTGRQSELTSLRFAVEYKATVMPLITPVAQTLVRLGERSGPSTRLRLVTNTGAALSRSVADGLRRVFPGVRVVPMYGMTECKRISIARPDADLEHPGTVGTALSATCVEVLDEDGKPLPAGSTGQIVVHGPHLMDGYWRDPQESARRFRAHPATGERCLFTGDYGILDAAGNLTFVGRRDDIFKRRGVRTSTLEIEAAALDIPEVHEAAAVLTGASRQCVLWVRGALRDVEVLRGVADRLGPARLPDRCLVIDALPRTSNGKIDKRGLERSLCNGER
ncbi:class I adenylate-forming enzyme family protein [Streptomyces sp. Wh19]|uniref:class I adenylate-forming enzyme family protein n=1 Tax=Streptomyces sp. Wh19 TaxID=3076629 RepID=UPI0029584B10|nr:class I adenylate-forming enzyme family protein [Streptomyces sp. Wh19]MDV9194462.1 class I adenylate-forming enzyme family protein [Streptomyces sp. Wh19]